MSKYENYITDLLNKNNVFFEREKTFNDLKKGLFRFDFYLPAVQGGPIAIELDGPQHFEWNKHFYKEYTDFKRQQENDRRKNAYCLAHKIPLFRIPYWDILDIKDVNELVKDKYRVKSQYHNDKLIRK